MVAEKLHARHRKLRLADGPGVKLDFSGSLSGWLPHNSPFSRLRRSSGVQRGMEWEAATGDTNSWNFQRGKTGSSARFSAGMITKTITNQVFNFHYCLKLSSNGIIQVYQPLKYTEAIAGDPGFPRFPRPLSGSGSLSGLERRRLQSGCQRRRRGVMFPPQNPWSFI